MIAIHVIVDDSQGPPLESIRDTVVYADESKGLTIVGLPGGMESGKPSLMLVCYLPDGTPVAIETSLALFQAANVALRGRYGDI